MSDSREWANHNPGDPIPVDGHVLVYLRYASGAPTKVPVMAGWVHWGHIGAVRQYAVVDKSRDG